MNTNELLQIFIFYFYERQKFLKLRISQKLLSQSLPNVNEEQFQTNPNVLDQLIHIFIPKSIGKTPHPHRWPSVETKIHFSKKSR